MRAYWATAWSTWPARTYRSPSGLAVFQSRGLVLDQAGVLRDGRVEATLAQQLFGSPEGLVAIHGPAGQDPDGGSPPDAIVSNSVAGRNERR